jgi:hypothetical protein
MAKIIAKISNTFVPIATLRRISSQDEEDNEKFQAIVVEGALELRGDQAPKAELPLFF